MYNNGGTVNLTSDQNIHAVKGFNALYDHSEMVSLSRSTIKSSLLSKGQQCTQFCKTRNVFYFRISTPKCLPLARAKKVLGPHCEGPTKVKSSPLAREPENCSLKCLLQQTNSRWNQSQITLITQGVLVIHKTPFF